MLKSEKGISLLTLIVTIVIMLILISIVVNSSLDSVEETNLTKINNEMKNIKDAVSIRITNHERNETLYPFVGEKITTFEKLEEYIDSIKNLSSGDKINIKNKLGTSYNADYNRLVGKIEAEKLGVEGIDVEHYYIVNYYDCEVYGPVSIKIENSGG